MYKYNRIILIILDSVGCGTQADYKKFHKKKCNTLLSVYKNNENFKLPNLEKMGLKKILFKENIETSYCAGKINVATAGNDTLASTWEMLGVTFKKRYRSLKRGFSKKIINKIERAIQTPVIGNEYIASGNAFKKYYKFHKETAFPMLYLADDGVVLLSAHEKIMPPKRLQKLGKITADILEHENVARVIVRSFSGKQKKFSIKKEDAHFPITHNLPLLPIFYYLGRNGIKILTTKHISMILGQPGHTNILREHFGNKDLLRLIKKRISKTSGKQLMIFCLRDFDKVGHKKDPVGYGQKLLEFDKFLPQITNDLKYKDLLVITADHGCDPTMDIRGHTREIVPLIIHSKQNTRPIWLKQRKTLADIGQTICYNYSLPALPSGSPITELFSEQ